jgi:oligosaccharide repeat unit polymerase
MTVAAAPFAVRKSRAAGEHRPMVLYWWARPHHFTVFFLIPLFVICASLPDRMFLNWKHTQNFITLEPFSVAMAALGGFALASLVVSHIGAPHPRSPGIGVQPRIAPAPYRAAVYFVFCITVAAYLLFLPQEIAATDIHSARQSRVVGITSFVNLGPLYATMLFLQITLTGCRLSRFDKIVFLLFLLLVTVRTFASSERLAIIEVLVPIAVIRFAPVKRRRMLMIVAPFAAVLALALFFGITEYFRSWSSYKSTGISLEEFMLTRLLGYYAAAVNSGAMLFTNFGPAYVPYFTGNWLVKMPLLADLNSSWATEMADRVDITFLMYGDPEFSNTSGLFAPMNDFGTLGGLGAWVILGIVTGRLFVGFTNRRLLSVLLFPTWMTGVYEILRIFYWGGTRYFPVLVLTPIIAAWLTTRSTASRRLSAA